MSGWSPDEIVARVEELRREHRGPAFVEAVSRFARDDLDRRERDVLGEILLGRARAEARNEELARRVKEGGWIRRTLRRAKRRSE